MRVCVCGGEGERGRTKTVREYWPQSKCTLPLETQYNVPAFAADLEAGLVGGVPWQYGTEF